MERLVDGKAEGAWLAYRRGGATDCGPLLSRLVRRPWRLRECLLPFAALCLASCGNVEPRAPKTDATYLLHYAPGRKSTSITNVDQARQLLDGYRAVLEDAATGRLKYEDAINEFTFYGTLVAVVGVAAKSIAARNIGAGIAGLSATLDGHYKLDKQSRSFINAYNRATCVLTAFNGIDLETYALFDQKPLDDVAGGGLKLDDAYAQIPNETMGAVQSITTLLQADLADILLASGNLSDIQKTATEVVTAANSAKAIVPQGASESARGVVATSKQSLLDAQTDLARTQDQAAGKGMLRAQAVVSSRATVAMRQKAADEAAVAAAAESAKKTVFLKSVAQFAAASMACTKVSP